MSTGLGDSSIKCLAINGTTLFAGTSFNGVYFSTNFGESWTSASTGSTIPTEDISALAVSTTTLYAGTPGNGLWERPIFEMVKTIDRNPQPSSIRHFDFKACSPRALDNKAVVSFSLPVTEQVSVAIFNMSRRKMNQ